MSYPARQSTESKRSTEKIRPTKLSLSDPPPTRFTKKTRKVLGLRNASLALSEPFPKTKQTGSRAKGMAYQRKVSRFFQQEMALIRKRKLLDVKRKGEIFYPERWIMFEDANGPGYAQPDLFIHTGENILVVECKLTRVGAWEQIALLYWPLLWRIFRVPLAGVEVFFNSGPGYVPHPEGPNDLVEALSLDDWTLAEWHLLL